MGYCYSMKHQKAQKVLKDLAEDIKLSNMGPYTKNYLLRPLYVLEQYISQVYTLLPIVVEND